MKKYCCLEPIREVIKSFLDKFTGNEYLYGTRENDDQMTYELDEKDLTYTLKTEEGQKLKIKP